MSKKIRITSVYVEFVMILGTILRQNLKMNFLRQECWEMEHVAVWCEVDEFPSSFHHLPDDYPWWNDTKYAEPFIISQHYLAAGKCYPLKRERFVSHATDETHLRASGTRHEQSTSDSVYWHVQLWTMGPNGKIAKHGFFCHTHDMCPKEWKELPSRMKPVPPHRIKFPMAGTDQK